MKAVSASAAMLGLLLVLAGEATEAVRGAPEGGAAPPPAPPTSRAAPEPPAPSPPPAAPPAPPAAAPRGPAAPDPPPPPPAPAAAPQALTSVGQRYCQVCHNDQLLTGNLALQGFDVARADRDVVKAEKMIVKLRAA